MLVERGNVKIANIFLEKRNKTKKNKDSYDVGREDKCKNCKKKREKKTKTLSMLVERINVKIAKKIEKKNKDSFDVGREEKCEASQGRKWPKGQLKACGSIFLGNLLQQHQMLTVCKENFRL